MNSSSLVLGKLGHWNGLSEMEKPANKGVGAQCVGLTGICTNSMMLSPPLLAVEGAWTMA